MGTSTLPSSATPCAWSSQNRGANVVAFARADLIFTRSKQSLRLLRLRLRLLRLLRRLRGRLRGRLHLPLTVTVQRHASAIVASSLMGNAGIWLRLTHLVKRHVLTKIFNMMRARTWARRRTLRPGTSVWLSPRCLKSRQGRMGQRSAGGVAVAVQSLRFLLTVRMMQFA